MTSDMRKLNAKTPSTGQKRFLTSFHERPRLAPGPRRSTAKTGTTIDHITASHIPGRMHSRKPTMSGTIAMKKAPIPAGLASALHRGMSSNLVPCRGRPRRSPRPNRVARRLGPKWTDDRSACRPGRGARVLEQYRQRPLRAVPSQELAGGVGMSDSMNRAQEVFDDAKRHKTTAAIVNRVRALSPHQLEGRIDDLWNTQRPQTQRLHPRQR